jgi:hypothetical protein
LGFGAQKVLRGGSAELGGEVFIAGVPRYSQAQFGLRTQITGVLHDASPDRVRNCVSTWMSKPLLNVSTTIVAGEGNAD